jgi:hypothetical protein
MIGPSGDFAFASCTRAIIPKPLSNIAVQGNSPLDDRPASSTRIIEVAPWAASFASCPPPSGKLLVSRAFIFGIMALALPMVTPVGVVLLLAWLILFDGLVFDGLVQLVHAFQSKGVGHIAWKLLVAALYLFAGAYLLAHPSHRNG